MASDKVTTTNKYLRDPKRRAAMILQSAKSSSAVEGIDRPFEERALRSGSYAKPGEVAFRQP